MRFLLLLQILPVSYRLIVEINRVLSGFQVWVAAVAVESLVHLDDLVGVGHPAVPMQIARTLQRVLRVGALTLALVGLVLCHRLLKSDAQVALLAVPGFIRTLRHQSQQRTLGAAVRFGGW